MQKFPNCSKEKNPINSILTVIELAGDTEQ